MAKYEIRKDGRIIATWEDPKLGYTKEEYKSMKENGYRLYVDGKLQR